MAVSPVGNVIHVNQNMQAQALKQADFQSRLNAQNAMASELMRDATKDTQEIRPIPKTHAIDPENEHEKHHKEDEQNHQSEPHTASQSEGEASLESSPAKDGSLGGTLDIVI